MIKGFRQIASLTALSRVFGMIRDISFAHFLGAGTFMNAWIIAFQIPNLARRLFGEGAASASFIPVYRQQLEKDPGQTAKLANTVVTVIFVLLSGLVILAWFGMSLYNSLLTPNPETKMMLSLVALMLPYMVMICTVAILAGILHVHQHFAAPAAAPIVLNIFIITTVLLTGWALKMPASQQVFAMAAAVLLAGIVQIAIQIPPLRASRVSIRPAWDTNSDAFRKIICLMTPMIIGLTATQINTLADTWIAKFFSSSPEKGEFFALLNTQIQYPLQPGAVSYLYYAQRLYQLPLGILGISLATAIFPVMSTNAAKEDFDGLRKTISKGIKAAIFVAVPATVGLLLVARPLVAAIFEHGQFVDSDAVSTTWILVFYALGLCGYFFQQIMTRAFYSMQDSRTPMRSAIIAVFANVVLNLTLIWFMGTAGLALSTAICSYLQVVILIFVLRKRLGSSISDGFLVTSVKTMAATIFMCLVGAAAIALMSKLPENRAFNILRLVAVVPLAAGVYLLAAKLLRIEVLTVLIGGKQNTQEATAHA